MEHLPAQTTLYSPGEESERPAPREPEQQLTLFRVGSLLKGDQRDLCLVKKVSRGGALVRAYCDLRQGEGVGLELKGQAPIDGTLASVNGTDAQIRFNQAVDVFGLLKVESGGPAPRMPRVDVRAFALIRVGAVVHRAVVHNISQGGIGAQCDAGLQVGEDATVTLTGMDPQPGVIRWSRSGACGITFNTMLGLPLLVEWLHAQTSAQAAPR